MADKNIKNPLQELYSDVSGTINTAELSAFLKPFIRISRPNKKVFFTPEGLQLPQKKKIILFLLARKALLLLEAVDEEEITPKEMKKELKKSIPSGTIDANLKRLSDRGLIRDDGGRYFIPDTNFSQIRDLF